MTFPETSSSPSSASSSGWIEPQGRSAPASSEAAQPSPAAACPLASYCNADDAEACKELTANEPCPPPLAWRDVLDAFRGETRRQEFQIDGRTILVRSWGTGRPIYFLNGLAGDSELSCLLAYLLRDEARCVLIDDPQGALHRLKTAGDGPACALAQDLFRVADTLDEYTFCLFAGSFGSAVALHAMLQRPGQIRAAVLHDAASQVRWSFAERRLFGLGRRLRTPLGRLPAFSRALEQMHRPWFPPFDETRWQFLRDNLGQTPLRELSSRAVAWMRPFADDDLRRIETPTLLLRTEGEGPVAAQRHEALIALHRHLRAEWMHSTGRLPYLTHPHRVAKAVREFLLSGPGS